MANNQQPTTSNAYAKTDRTRLHGTFGTTAELANGCFCPLLKVAASNEKQAVRVGRRQHPAVVAVDVIALATATAACRCRLLTNLASEVPNSRFSGLVLLSLQERNCHNGVTVLLTKIGCRFTGPIQHRNNARNLAGKSFMQAIEVLP